MVLVDTSVWVDFFAGGDLPHVARIEGFIPICRSLRSRGLAFCNTVDCLLAANCIHHGGSLLHDVRDFDAIAGRFPQKITKWC